MRGGPSWGNLERHITMSRGFDRPYLTTPPPSLPNAHHLKAAWIRVAAFEIASALFLSREAARWPLRNTLVSPT